MYLYFSPDPWVLVRMLTSDFTPEEDLVGLDVGCELDTGEVEAGALLNIEGDAIGAQVLDLRG